MTLLAGALARLRAFMYRADHSSHASSMSGHLPIRAGAVAPLSAASVLRFIVPTLAVVVFPLLALAWRPPPSIPISPPPPSPSGLVEKVFAHARDASGAVYRADVSPDDDDTRRANIRALVDDYLAPWHAFAAASAILVSRSSSSSPPLPGVSAGDESGIASTSESSAPSSSSAVVPHYPIPRALLDWMEVPLHGGAARIRVYNGSVYYRVIDHYPQTYRLQRLEWFLRFVHDAVARASASAPADRRITDTEFYLNLGDRPRATADSSASPPAMAGLPLFSFRTSDLHIDIPVPDPVEYGSNGEYTLQAQQTPAAHDANRTSTTSTQSPSIDADDDNLPWEQRHPRAFFRGVTSAFAHHDGNDAADARILLHLMNSAERATDDAMLDAGVVEYMKFARTRTGAGDASHAALPSPLPRTPLSAMRRYKYVLDVDGGLGSSRKRGIMLSSGATPFFQRSPWRQWYEPLLQPHRHYVPVDRWLRDLRARVRWARAHDDDGDSAAGGARGIASEARRFAESYLSYDAALEYFCTLLGEYTRLLEPLATPAMPATASESDDETHEQGEQGEREEEQQEEEDEEQWNVDANGSGGEAATSASTPSPRSLPRRGSNTCAASPQHSSPRVTATAAAAAPAADDRPYPPPVPQSPCVLRPVTRNGPLGCSRRWLRYEPRGAGSTGSSAKSTSSLPFGCKYKREANPPHRCWRTTKDGRRQEKRGWKDAYE